MEKAQREIMSLVGISNANKDHRPPTPPPEGESKTAEGGARTQSLNLTNTLLDRIEETKQTRNPAVANNNQESKERQKKTPDQNTIAKTRTTGRN